jgi:nicotinate-nucleotide adenylyltransferase
LSTVAVPSADHAVPRVGMFGGAFDPPHLAHVAVAEAAVAQLGLDRLHVFPTGQPWHRSAGVTAAGHRLAMTRLAMAGIGHVLVDDAELRRDGPTYSIDTLEALRQAYPDSPLFLILGADQAAQIERWHRWQDLVRLVTVCVVGRGPLRQGPSPGAKAGHPGLPREMPVQTLKLHMTPQDISATEIRRRLAAGEDISALVPAGVARYIADQKLYQDP